MERASCAYPDRRGKCGSARAAMSTRQCSRALDYGRGGYATHVMVPHQRYCSKWRASCGDCRTLMCSGLTGYGAIKKAIPYLRAGPLLIVGLGGVGMMGLQFARALTDKPIFVADIDAAKRDAALKLGAKEAFDPADAGARKAIGKASGGGVGAAVDFAGSDKSLGFAQGAVTKGGAAIVVGLIGGSFTLPVPMFPLRALTIMGSTGVDTEREMIDSSGGKSRRSRREAPRDRPAARSMICAKADRRRVVITP